MQAHNDQDAKTRILVSRLVRCLILEELTLSELSQQIFFERRGFGTQCTREAQFEDFDRRWILLTVGLVQDRTTSKLKETQT